MPAQDLGQSVEPFLLALARVDEQSPLAAAEQVRVCALKGELYKEEQSQSLQDGRNLVKVAFEGGDESWRHGRRNNSVKVLPSLMASPSPDDYCPVLAESNVEVKSLPDLYTHALFSSASTKDKLAHLARIASQDPDDIRADLLPVREWRQLLCHPARSSSDVAARTLAESQAVAGIVQSPGNGQAHILFVYLLLSSLPFRSRACSGDQMRCVYAHTVWRDSK